MQERVSLLNESEYEVLVDTSPYDWKPFTCLLDSNGTHFAKIECYNSKHDSHIKGSGRSAINGAFDFKGVGRTALAPSVEGPYSTGSITWLYALVEYVKSYFASKILNVPNPNVAVLKLKSDDKERGLLVRLHKTRLTQVSKNRNDLMKGIDFRSAVAQIAVTIPRAYPRKIHLKGPVDHNFDNQGNYFDFGGTCIQPDYDPLAFGDERYPIAIDYQIIESNLACWAKELSFDMEDFVPTVKRTIASEFASLVGSTDLNLGYRLHQHNLNDPLNFGDCVQYEISRLPVDDLTKRSMMGIFNISQLVIDELRMDRLEDYLYKAYYGNRLNETLQSLFSKLDFVYKRRQAKHMHCSEFANLKTTDYDEAIATIGSTCTL